LRYAPPRIGAEKAKEGAAMVDAEPIK